MTGLRVRPATELLNAPAYLLDAVGVWQPFAAPFGPHRGHTLVVRKIRERATFRVAVAQCVRCRTRWSFIEYRDPGGDERRVMLQPPRGWPRDLSAVT